MSQSPLPSQRGEDRRKVESPRVRAAVRCGRVRVGKCARRVARVRRQACNRRPLEMVRTRAHRVNPAGRGRVGP